MESSPVKTLSPQPSGSPAGRKPFVWGSPQGVVNPQPVTPCSLSAVMDEELAKEIQKKEEEHVERLPISTVTPPLPSTTTLPTTSDESTSSDYLLAQMLQFEYDKEHDRQLRLEEKQFNEHNKVKISFDKYRSVPDYYRENEDSQDEEDEPAEDYEDDYHSRVSPPVKAVAVGRRKGVSPGNPTKHDEKICGRKNVENMEKFPPDYPVGDIEYSNADFSLSNRVFNTLKEHSQKELKHSQRLHEKKEHSTHEHVLDSKTRLMLFKMVDNGRLKEINGCISTGKESAVYHAEGGENEDGSLLPKECAVKVFKTTLNEFFRRDKYIKDDYRFKNRFSKQNPRKIIKMWAEKEMFNLKRMHRYGIPCPEVVVLRKHVLIMGFIGRDQVPAPKLKDVQLDEDQWNSAYHQCVQCMERMYKECHLVHADLSEYNMLWFEGRVHFIDVSQSVEPSNPHGLELLLRDCRNVTNFFPNKGVQDVPSSHELFNRITGLDISAINDQEFVAQVRAHTQRQLLMDTLYDKKQSYPFDYFFEETSKNKMSQEPVSRVKVSVNNGPESEDDDSSSISSGDEEGSESESEDEATITPTTH